MAGDMEKSRGSRANAFALNIVGFFFGLLLTIATWVSFYFLYYKPSQDQESEPDY